MKTEKIIGAALIFYAIYKMSKQKPYIPPQPQGTPQNNYQNWLVWAGQAFNALKNFYGDIREMWQPGGIFYKTPVPEYDAGSTFWQDVGLAGIG